MKNGRIYIGSSGLYKTFDMLKFAEEKKKEVYNSNERGTYGNKVNYYTAVQISDLLRRNEKTIDQIAGCHTLCIDDLGKEHKVYGEELLPTVIDRFYDLAYQHKHIPLTLMITTNLSLEVLNERYGSHLVDRIAELCVIENRQGDSVRMQSMEIA